MKTILTIACAIALALGLADSAAADTKVTKKMSTAGAGAGMEMTEYVKGKRIRTEMVVAGQVLSTTLQQCDLGRTVQINPNTKKYFVMQNGDAPAASPAAAKPASAARKGGVVTTTTTITDTGERKQLLGMTARRIKTVMVQEPGPGACTQIRSTVETDGWYVDLDGFGDGCSTAAASMGAGMGDGGCRDEYRTKVIGTAKLGYPVLLSIQTGPEAGSAETTFEVVELSTVQLDDALFDLPAGYREVSSFAELMMP